MDCARRDFLVSDGQTIAFGYPSMGTAWVANCFVVRQVDYNCDWGGRQEMNVHLSVFGPARTMPIDDAARIFADANKLSVNELLALLYRKLEEREA